MTNEEVLLRAVAAEPDEDTPRLMLADAVQEAGDADLAARIRTGVLCHCVSFITDEAHADAVDCFSCQGTKWRPRCEADGCREAGSECYMDAAEGEEHTVDARLCAQHASEAGFCHGCGQFWAGVESFDFSRSGLCEHCQDGQSGFPDDEFDDDEYEDGDDNWIAYGPDPEEV